MRRGFAEGAIGALGLWLAVLLGVAFVPPPSEQLLSDVAGIGATLLIAYAVEVTWLVKVSEVASLTREEWIGFVTSFGVAGLIGIAVALGLAEHLAAGHRNWLDHVGFAWVVSSLGLLGLSVAAQPLMTYEWLRGEKSD